MKSLNIPTDKVNENSTWNPLKDPLLFLQDSPRAKAREELTRLRSKLLSAKKERGEVKKQSYLDQVRQVESNRKDNACIRSITEQGESGFKESYLYEGKEGDFRLNVFPGRVDIRSGHIVGGKKNDDSRKRSEISYFSRKSRRNMFKTFGEILETFEMWQTFTFSDDVMEGLTENERCEFAAAQLHRFSVWVQRQYPGIGMFWRKENETRKSGKLAGSKVPHYHIMYYVPGVETEEEYIRIARVIGSNWVRQTGTFNPKAYEVAIHPDSYERIDSRKKAIAYIGKYMAKPDTTIKGENDKIGRMWGYFGKVTFAVGETVKVKIGEMIVMKRMLRRYAKRSKRMKKALGKLSCNTFVMAPGKMIFKLLSWITGEEYQGDYGGLVPGIPF